jgi:hypothetical protein
MVAFVAAQTAPTWWTALFPTYRSGALTWLVLLHVAGVLLLSLPFAFAIDRVFRPYGMWVALAVAIVIACVIEVPSLIEGLKSTAFYIKGFWVVDTVELISVLPALVYIVRRLTSKETLIYR